MVNMLCHKIYGQNCVNMSELNNKSESSIRSKLSNKKIAIWGFGREGRAALSMLRKELPDISLFVFEQNQAVVRELQHDHKLTVVSAPEKIAATIPCIDVIIKSPGISLYSPLIKQAQREGVLVTSLLNIWAQQNPELNKIMVTGTKGKSTTTKLIAHMLNALGNRTSVAGNIGLAVSELDLEYLDYTVLEVSSYQSANFIGHCEIAALTSLFPEHLDWHGDLETYYKDKLNLLVNAKWCAISSETLSNMPDGFVQKLANYRIYGDASTIHAEGTTIYNGNIAITEVNNSYLQSAHNMLNVCAAITILQYMKLDIIKAIKSLDNFTPLPHRLHEIKKCNDLLFVDDSISTSVESTIAALNSYHPKATTIILGGADRGLEYHNLVQHLLTLKNHRQICVICMGISGQRIFDQLTFNSATSNLEKSDFVKKDTWVFMENSMEAAIQVAIQETPKPGVVLLSPAAPSYDVYRNYEEKSTHFLKCIEEYENTLLNVRESTKK